MIARKLKLVTVGARSISVVGPGPRSLKTQPMTSLTWVGQKWPKIGVFATKGLYSPMMHKNCQWANYPRALQWDTWGTRKPRTNREHRWSASQRPSEG